MKIDPGSPKLRTSTRPDDSTIRFSSRLCARVHSGTYLSECRCAVEANDRSRTEAPRVGGHARQGTRAPVGKQPVVEGHRSAHILDCKIKKRTHERSKYIMWSEYVYCIGLKSRIKAGLCTALLLTTEPSKEDRQQRTGTQLFAHFINTSIDVSAYLSSAIELKKEQISIWRVCALRQRPLLAAPCQRSRPSASRGDGTVRPTRHLSALRPQETTL